MPRHRPADSATRSPSARDNLPSLAPDRAKGRDLPLLAQRGYFSAIAVPRLAQDAGSAVSELVRRRSRRWLFVSVFCLIVAYVPKLHGYPVLYSDLLGGRLVSYSMSSALEIHARITERSGLASLRRESTSSVSWHAK